MVQFFKREREISKFNDWKIAPKPKVLSCVLPFDVANSSGRGEK
jgi:hypothetical protein